MTTDAQIITAGQNGRDGVPDGRRRAVESPPASLWRIITSVLWVACLTVGVLGLWLRYRAPSLPPGATKPVQAQLITVEVSNDPSVLADSGPPRARDNLEPPPDSAAPPQAPPLPAVAAPSPEVAFALPVVGPTRTVDKSEAGFAHPEQNQTPTSHASQGPMVQHLTYGRGEGAQPAPDYPRESIAAGQQGVVGVRFDVGEDGRVTSAEVISPCRWPRLNQSALLTVRERWRFRAGPARVYEVSIRFELN